MSFDNKILGERAGKITFDCNTRIILSIRQIKKVFRYTCPLKMKDITNSDEWLYDGEGFEADDPGRYYIEYEV